MSCEVRALVSLPIPTTAVVRRINQGLRLLGYPVRSTMVSVAFIDDRRMRVLNARYRHHRETTDVLSFQGTGNVLGELVISLPQARRQSATYRTTIREELDLLLVHGLLHLAGHDHERPKQRRAMQQLEQKLLKGQSLIHRAHA